MPEGSRSTILVWVIAAVLATVAAVQILGDDRAPPAAVSVSDSSETSAAAGAHDGRGRSGGIYVHVAGAVRRPGLMRLPPGSRVAVALERAGGPSRRADLTAVNLAARLHDGQQIVVPARGAAAAGGAAASAGAAGGPLGVAGSAGGMVHLSTATIEQLDGIDGIGPTLAQRIIEYRDAHGGLRSLAELAQVDGIGEKRLATLREALQP
ncbi:MAG TPA: ComEA family DNA-binding protein [Thermoleophilaceae bacterium]|nr:ComEA family DNA-binding protein [Thermoleophilaceae bacterium]